MHQLQADEIKNRIQPGQKAVITVHRGPDGDAIGSGLAMGLLLQKAGMETTVVVPDDYPDFLKWPPGTDAILIYDQKVEEVKAALSACDTLFCLDFNTPDRMGKLTDTVLAARKPTVLIDHHRQPGDFADFYYVDDTASATAELIYRLFDDMGLLHLVDRDVATCLYLGLVTDTGSFRFPAVTPRVMRIAADLMEAGVDHSALYDKVYGSNREEQLKLVGHALSKKLRVIADGKVAYISLTNEELHHYHYRKGDTEGLVNQALSIAGVEMAAFFAETEDLVKISLRSIGEVDVNTFARAHFEGGGHKNAAGGRMPLPVGKAIEVFEREAPKIFETVS